MKDYFFEAMKDSDWSEFVTDRDFDINSHNSLNESSFKALLVYEPIGFCFAQSKNLAHFTDRHRCFFRFIHFRHLSFR